MRIIALIDDPKVIRRILDHLGRWASEATEHGPPAQAPDWPQNAVILPRISSRTRHRAAQCQGPAPLRIRAILT